MFRGGGEGKVGGSEQEPLIIVSNVKCICHFQIDAQRELRTKYDPLRQLAAKNERIIGDTELASSWD